MVNTVQVSQTLTNEDVAWARAQFPALEMLQDGKQVMFFDGAAGTQVPQRVIDAVVKYYKESNANFQCSYLTSERSDAIIEDAHAALADFLGCDADEVIVGPNMTTLTFHLSRSILRELKKGDEVVISMLDHEANIGPWQSLEEHGIVVRKIPVRVENCTLDLDALKQIINPKTKLVAVGYASNAVGTINDVNKVTELAHSVGALSFIDAVHYAPHGPIDVRKIDCDFLACSPYKFFAPHLGAIYGKREHLTRLKPYKVRPATEELPYRWETGTQNHECLAGLVAGLDYLAELGKRVNPNANTRRKKIVSAMTAIKEYEKTLTERVLSKLSKLPNIKVYGIQLGDTQNERTPTIACTMKGKTAGEVTGLLGECGIFMTGGNCYALSLIEQLQLQESGLFRIAMVHYNTIDEVDRLIETLAKV
jgi:cysteine desulfurase family protein (TIGR01976 family)